MRLLRALIVEDEWVARHYLVELLQESQLAEAVAAVTTVRDAREALLGTDRLDVDVAFLDIALAGCRHAGLELARELSSVDGAPSVVLATAFKEHAVEAFSLGVSDYLLKPFTEERVEQCLRRVQGLRSALPTRVASSRIVARQGKKLVFFDPEEVWAFEAADRLTQVHTPHGVFELDLSLKAISISIGRALMRVHRNWLVNGQQIKELERDGGETRLFIGRAPSASGPGLVVPVARERAAQVRELLLAGSTGLRR
jgi:DNA-binding LytR/AlgR family response regulator